MMTAIVKSIMRLCEEGSILRYYRSLHNRHCTDDIIDREHRVHTSDRTALSYYTAMNFDSKSVIYCSYMDDVKRGVLTRWRLSNHRLKIELGRYHRPMIPRNERICDVCGVLDDEYHAVFICAKFESIRVKYNDLLLRNDTIQKFLNPSFGHKEMTAAFLIEIENVLG